MYHKEYKNFVKSKPFENKETLTKTNLNGKEIRKYYLNEVENAINFTHQKTEVRPCARKRVEEVDSSNHSLFLSVQNNDVVKLRKILDISPDKINILDEYGWTLLMIACQANSTDCVIELLNRGIDITIEDKAGNSAKSLVLRNKNVILANLLLSNCIVNHHSPKKLTEDEPVAEQFVCVVCNNQVFPDRKEHLSSTLHNIIASKGKKFPPNFIIPESNKGYQLMLKGGWDKESGLGPNRSGNKYPIKTVLKNDRKGLGLKTKKHCDLEGKECNKTTVIKNYQKNRRLEIDFRREFY